MAAYWAHTKPRDSVRSRLSPAPIALHQSSQPLVADDLAGGDGNGFRRWVFRRRQIQRHMPNPLVWGEGVILAQKLSKVLFADHHEMVQTLQMAWGAPTA